MALEITKTNLSEVLESDLVVLDFWAQWCGPCRMIGPIIDELSLENEDVTVGKVNVDSNQDIATEYGIRGIPTVLFIKNGEVVDRLVGANTKTGYQEKIDSLKG